MTLNSLELRADEMSCIFKLPRLRYRELIRAHRFLRNLWFLIGLRLVACGYSILDPCDCCSGSMRIQLLTMRERLRTGNRVVRDVQTIGGDSYSMRRVRILHYDIRVPTTPERWERVWLKMPGLAGRRLPPLTLLCPSIVLQNTA